MHNERLLHAVLRTDFASFINKVFDEINPGIEYENNWHINLLADYLEAVRLGQIRRLIINIPPRSLKSICISVAWPAWILGHNATKRIIACSYSSSLSIKHSLDCRFVVNSAWYKAIFPETTLSTVQNQKSKFLTTNNGFRFATSVYGSTTGEGGDYLIADDPHNPIHIHSPKMRAKTIEWFEQTFLSRLNNKNSGAVVIVMQRLHEEDITGYLSLNNKSWEILSIPIQSQQDTSFQINQNIYHYPKGEVLHKLRDKEEYLKQLSDEVGMRTYAAQYLQEPLKQNGSILPLESIRFYESLPMQFNYIVHSWDTAIKTSHNSDYSVCVNFGVIDKHYYLISIIREKLTYSELKANVLKMIAQYNPKFVVIEDKASGQQLIQDLTLEHVKGVVKIKPKYDKITRFAASTLAFESGQILLPKYSKFNPILLEELTTFPNSRHDDVVDAISQFVNFMKSQLMKTDAKIRKL